MAFLTDYFKKTASRKLDVVENVEKPSDLYNIRGLNKPIIERLEEEGIYSCQNLAYCDPIKLILKTNFQLKILLDWIDQALLYIYVGDKIHVLSSKGVRGIVELAALHDTNDKLRASIASELGVTPEQLDYFVGNVYEDPHVDFIWDLLSEYSEDEDIDDADDGDD